jgi:hypothetical protein
MSTEATQEEIEFLHEFAEGNAKTAEVAVESYEEFLGNIERVGFEAATRNLLATGIMSVKRMGSLAGPAALEGAFMMVATYTEFRVESSPAEDASEGVEGAAAG